VARKEEKPSLGKRLTEWAMTAGVLVLLGGLVCAFLVAGIFVLHRSLSRNEDENMVVHEGASRPAAETKQSALEDLKKPLPSPKLAVDPQSVAVKPADLADIAPAPAKPLEKPKESAKPAPVAPPAPPPAPPSPSTPEKSKPLPPPAPPAPPAAKVPAGPPSRDPSRMDNEGFIRYWLILAPLPSEKERASGAEVAALRLPDEANQKPKPGENVLYKGKQYAWTKYNTPEYFIDFKKTFAAEKTDNALAYAVAYVSCEEEIRDVKVLAGTNDAGRLYINGKLIFSHEKPRSLEPDATIVNGVTLVKGQNVILLKVANETGNWGGCVRFMDKNGTPIRHLLLSSMPK
jgi:hypothetical protein